MDDPLSLGFVNTPALALLSAFILVVLVVLHSAFLPERTGLHHFTACHVRRTGAGITVCRAGGEHRAGLDAPQEESIAYQREGQMWNNCFLKSG